MGTQQFCLRWNNHQSNMLNVFDQLLRNEAFVDVTLACEGVSVKAHKMVLSACSPYFQNLFLENPCQHPIVILKDMKYSELRAIIDFMYKGEINVSQDQLSALLKTAETLKVKGLAEVSTGNVPNAGAELPNQDDSGVSPGGTGGSGVSSGVGGSGGSGGGGGTAGGSGAMSCASGSGGGVGSGGGASMGPGSPSGDGRSSPPTKRKRHRQGRRPSNGDLSDTGERSGDQQFDSEALARLKSEPLEPAAETHVEVVMEPPSQQYDLEVPSSLERCLSEAREREISLIPRSDGITTGSSSSGHGNLNQPQPSTSGTSQTSQDDAESQGGDASERASRGKVAAEEQLHRALEDVRSGRMSYSKAAANYGIPFSRLYRQGKAEGIGSAFASFSGAKHSEADLHQALEEVRSGALTFTDAARKFNIPVSTLTRHGNAPQHPDMQYVEIGAPQDKLERALADVRSGLLSFTRASTLYGIPLSTLYSKAKARGIHSAFCGFQKKKPGGNSSSSAAVVVVTPQRIPVSEDCHSSSSSSDKPDVVSITRRPTQAAPVADGSSPRSPMSMHPPSPQPQALTLQPLQQQQQMHYQSAPTHQVHVYPQTPVYEQMQPPQYHLHHRAHYEHAHHLTLPSEQHHHQYIHRVHHHATEPLHLDTGRQQQRRDSEHGQDESRHQEHDGQGHLVEARATADLRSMLVNPGSSGAGETPAVSSYGFVQTFNPPVIVKSGDSAQSPEN